MWEYVHLEVYKISLAKEKVYIYRSLDIPAVGPK
jgi:hypothetical protein